MQGILLVDKPIGWTSFDVVNYIRKIIAEDQKVKPTKIKVGHIGTLDPLASGLLVLLVGKEYTTRAAILAKLDKDYEVEMYLGQISATGDSESEPTIVSDRIPTPAELKTALDSFVGHIDQTPPAYSAVKIKGQRAYQLAREGKPVALKPRPVIIYNLKTASYDYPKVLFTTRVSSGTYIRSLVKDIGDKLGVGAYMSGLTRTRIGPFYLIDSLQLEALTVSQITNRLLTPEMPG